MLSTSNATSYEMPDISKINSLQFSADNEEVMKLLLPIFQRVMQRNDRSCFTEFRNHFIELEVAMQVLQLNGYLDKEQQILLTILSERLLECIKY